MAIIKNGILGSVHGTINDITFQKVRKTNYAKSKVTPIDPATPLQLQARAKLSTVMRWQQSIYQPFLRGTWHNKAKGTSPWNYFTKWNYQSYNIYGEPTNVTDMTPGDLPPIINPSFSWDDHGEILTAEWLNNFASPGRSTDKVAVIAFDTSDYSPHFCFDYGFRGLNGQHQSITKYIGWNCYARNCIFMYCYSGSYPKQIFSYCNWIQVPVP